ncbi:MAG TPA: Uma2 family endonuclease, partial [Bryobacteraceae bacterium]|nr:Uma2 family endonuclease [Bryobacteraceae bacterium]
DVAVFHTERLAEEGRLINGAPDIAIEVVSPTDTVSGLRRKIKAYLENGARAVWIFYDDGSVATHTASQVRELKGDQLLEDPLLPGFSVAASTFFTQA